MMSDNLTDKEALGCGCILLIPAVLFFLAVCAVLVRIIVWAVVG